MEYSVALVLVLSISQVFGGTVPLEAGSDGQAREGRFYGGGLASSQASAVASSGATGFGGGYPLGFGGGLGFAGSSAHAAAQSGAVGFGK